MSVAAFLALGFLIDYSATRRRTGNHGVRQTPPTRARSVDCILAPVAGLPGADGPLLDYWGSDFDKRSYHTNHGVRPKATTIQDNRCHGVV